MESSMTFPIRTSAECTLCCRSISAPPFRIRPMPTLGPPPSQTRFHSRFHFNPRDAPLNGAVFSNIYNNLTDANSNYNSLQVSLTRRFGGGFQMSHAYTWSHSIDDASSGGITVTPGSRIDSARADRGNSSF